MFNDDDAPALQHAFLRCTSEPILILKISIKITNFDKVLNQQFQSQNVTIDFEESSRASFVCERNFAIVMTTKKTFGLLRFFLLRSSRNLFFFVDFSMATASSQSLLAASSAGAAVFHSSCFSFLLLPLPLPLLLLKLTFVVVLLLL